MLIKHCSNIEYFFVLNFIKISLIDILSKSNSILQINSKAIYLLIFFLNKTILMSFKNRKYDNKKAFQLKRFVCFYDSQIQTQHLVCV